MSKQEYNAERYIRYNDGTEKILDTMTVQADYIGEACDIVQNAPFTFETSVQVQQDNDEVSLTVNDGTNTMTVKLNIVQAKQLFKDTEEIVNKLLENIDGWVKVALIAER